MALDRAGDSWLTLGLTCREPFDGRTLLRYLAARAVLGLEQVTGSGYTRTVHAPGGPGIVQLVLPGAPGGGPGPGTVLLRASLPQPRDLGHVAARCRAMLGLGADPEPVNAALAADDLLAPLVAARPGLRVPGTCDGFELAARAVLGQQVSLAAARTLLGRLAERFGTRLGAAAGAAPTLAFPAAATVAGADLSGLGITGARQAALRALAAAVADGRLALDRGADPGQTAAQLARLSGIGPWTCAYILMRALGDPDAFPATDLALRRALARLGAGPDRVRTWRPWRAYAAMHLWAAEADRPRSQPRAPGRSGRIVKEGNPVMATGEQ